MNFVESEQEKAIKNIPYQGELKIVTEVFVKQIVSDVIKATAQKINEYDCVNYDCIDPEHDCAEGKEFRECICKHLISQCKGNK